MVAGQWEVWLTPCAKSITVPVTAAASLDELKEAVLNACMVATPELVPVSWLDASRIRQAMVLSARADAGDLTAIRFDDLRTLTPALQADVVPAEEAAALALLQAEEQRRQALVEAAALEALTFARANPLPPPLRSVPFLLRRTVPMYSIGIAWGAQYARARPLLPELGLPPWALWVAWLAGPVSGLVVQPLVGQLSDRTRGSSRCFAGKRRQWMWVGSLGLSASMLLMSSCSDLGLALGDAGNGTHPAARVLALLAFCSAGAFLSVLQGPARTLVVDAAPPEQQALAPDPNPSQLHPSSGRQQTLQPPRQQQQHSRHRALVRTLPPPTPPVPWPRQALANALFAVWDSLGKLSGFACGALLPDILPSASQHASGSSAFGSSAQQRLHLAADHPAPGGRALFADGRALFGLGVLALLVTQARTPGVALQTLHSLPATRPAAPPATRPLPHTFPHALPQTVNQIGYVEPPPHPDAHAERLGHPFRPLLSSLRLVPTMPRRVRGVLACLLFLFLAWFATWLHLPAFMAVELFGGSSDAALADDDPAKLAYNEGTRAYRLGMAGACRPRLPFPHAARPTPSPPRPAATPLRHHPISPRPPPDHHTPAPPLLARQARRRSRSRARPRFPRPRGGGARGASCWRSSCCTRRCCSPPPSPPSAPSPSPPSSASACLSPVSSSSRTPSWGKPPPRPLARATTWRRCTSSSAFPSCSSALPQGQHVEGAVLAAPRPHPPGRLGSAWRGRAFTSLLHLAGRAARRGHGRLDAHAAPRGRRLVPGRSGAGVPLPRRVAGGAGRGDGGSRSAGRGRGQPARRRCRSRRAGAARTFQAGRGGWGRPEP